MNPTLVIRSRSNPALLAARRLAQDGSHGRREGRIWVEGEHLMRAAMARGWPVEQGWFVESLWPEVPVDIAQAATKTILVADPLWSRLSALGSPAAMAFVLRMPDVPAPLPGQSAVVLDRLQDPGNAGAILRCAAAFGFAQVLAMAGTVSLWSPKVVRAGMGAHFGLTLVEALAPTDLAGLQLPLLSTSSHTGEWLHRARLPWPCAWMFGHEGQGVSPALQALATRTLRIVQPGGEESLNVASAAAICLHASGSALAGPGMPAR